MDPYSLGRPNRSSESLVLLLSQDPIENRVIRALGMELAQVRLDLSFANARLTALREVVEALSRVVLDGHEPPPGYAYVPGDLMMTLQSILSSPHSG